MKQKTWYLALLVLLMLLLLSSIPRIDQIQSVDISKISDYPILQDSYAELCEQYSLYEITTEDTIRIVTIKNIWGRWERYILPCYSVYLPSIPTAGSVDSHAALYVLAPWSHENIFTDLFRLKVRDFSLYLEPGENLFVNEHAELTHANMYPVRHIVPARFISFSEAVICDKLPTVFVDYSVATNSSAMKHNQSVSTVFTWEYSLRFMGKQLRAGTFILEKEHFVNT